VPGQVEGRRVGRRHGLEDKRGNHAEVATPRTPQRPEQVRFTVFVALDDAAVRQHHPRSEQAIRGQPVLAAEDAEPTA
jgi:hypothetical protein